LTILTFRVSWRDRGHLHPFRFICVMYQLLICGTGPHKTIFTISVIDQLFFKMVSSPQRLFLSLFSPLDSSPSVCHRDPFEIILTSKIAFGFEACYLLMATCCPPKFVLVFKYEHNNRYRQVICTGLPLTSTVSPADPDITVTHV
jgi:hypothetical protein